MFFTCFKRFIFFVFICLMFWIVVLANVGQTQLREEKNADTMSYLNAENSYTGCKMKHTETLQQDLYNEMLSRIVEDDSSVPAKRDEYYYYSRTETGKAYKIHCRKKGKDGKEEILLDENKLGEKESFFDIGQWEVSPNHEILAYSADTKGNEVYTLRFQNLKTGKLYDDEIQ
ncbi:protease II, partial [Reticulomyxa filosa]